MGRVVMAAVAGLLLLAGCSDDEPSPGAGGESAPRTPDATTSPRPAPSLPATTSGDLGADDVPSPAGLGKGWSPEANPGGHEAGPDNGTNVRARSPENVVRSLVPLGCPGVSEIPQVPRPAHALQATYRGPDGEPAVALVLEYRTSDPAVQAIRRIARMRATCSTRQGAPTSPAIEMRRATDAVVWDLRQDRGPDPQTWLEVAKRSGARLALVARSQPGPATDNDFRAVQGILPTQR